MKRIAGVPVPVWLIAAAAAVALGLYLRHRAIATNTRGAVSSGPTTFDDLTYSLAGGSVANAPTGLDPGLTSALLAGSVTPSGAPVAPATGSTGPNTGAGAGLVKVGGFGQPGAPTGIFFQPGHGNVPATRPA